MGDVLVSVGVVHVLVSVGDALIFEFHIVIFSPVRFVCSYLDTWTKTCHPYSGNLSQSINHVFLVKLFNCLIVIA